MAASQCQSTATTKPTEGHHAFYLLAVVNVFVSGMAFGVLVRFDVLIVVVPVVLVISMLPISLGGIGLQEWAYVFTFAAAGVGGSVGLLVALLMRLKSLVNGLIGAALYARESSPRAKAANVSV